MTQAAKNPQQDDAFSAMDRMYRIQRHFYDATRKFYLLGRDKLITEIVRDPGSAILEVGCGTGRNLILLAKQKPAAECYGLDASSAMLETARSNIERARLSNIILKTALADEFGYLATFDRPEKFDVVFFSYSISMIPPWKESIDNALANLKPGGKLYIVDFFDQKGLPAWFQEVLNWWLSKFHVKHWDGLIPYLESEEMQKRCEVRITPLYRRYSFLAELELR